MGYPWIRWLYLSTKNEKDVFDLSSHLLLKDNIHSSRQVQRRKVMWGWEHGSRLNSIFSTMSFKSQTRISDHVVSVIGIGHRQPFEASDKVVKCMVLER